MRTLLLLLILVIPAPAAATLGQDHQQPLQSPSSGSPEPPRWARVRDWSRVRGPVDIEPTGWRRVDGQWYRSDGRPLPDPNPGRTINDLIRHQRNLEAASLPVRCVAPLMTHLRSLDPITLASSQISLISLLGYLVLRRR